MCIYLHLLCIPGTYFDVNALTKVPQDHQRGVAETTNPQAALRPVRELSGPFRAQVK